MTGKSARFVCLFVSVFTLTLFVSSLTVSAAGPKEIRIGASLPKTGILNSFGLYAGWGYNKAVEEVNKAGGLPLSKYGTTVPVKLIIYDDESKPEKVVSNTERLILRDEVHGMLASATPPLVLSGAAVAEREGIPMSAALCPIRAFLGGKEQWNWVWDIFFDELDMTDQQFLTMDTVASNKKVALFTDNEQDGVIMGKLWEEKAKKFGYDVVYHANFPVGTSEYGDLIRRAQAANAEIMICQMITPDSIALCRQMQALGYKPKAAFFEKGGEPVEWWQANGDAAQGTLVTGYWHYLLDFPGAKELKEQFEKESGSTYSQHIADGYTAAMVLLDAIKAAGSEEPKAVAEAMSKTDKTYVLGHVKYTEGKGARASIVPSFMLQWQNGETQVVYPPKWKTADLIYPMP